MTKLNKPRYRYENVELISIYDADTITLLVRLGFKVDITIRVRLARIDAFEVRGKEKEKGKQAKNYLENRLIGQKIVIETFKDLKGKYGRYIAEIYVGDENMNDTLVKEGHAEYREY